MFEKLFRLRENGTNVRTEVIAGATTFVTMAYIIFVQPLVLSGEFLGPGKPAGVVFMDKTGVMLATCLASALASFLMALLANYPIALAPGMGENFFYGLIVAGLVSVGTVVSWQAAMGVVFLSGVIFIILSLFRFRETIVNAIPRSLKNAIALGIGLLIAFLGFTGAGIVVRHPSPTAYLKMGDLLTPQVGVAAVGLLVTAALMVRRVKGALLIGMLAAAIVALLCRLTSFSGVVAAPDFGALGRTAFQLDIAGALRVGLITLIVVFLLMDLFDTVGTLVGVAEQAGMLDAEGRLPRVGRALMADALGTTAGALLGTSTVTSYIESAAGVQQGGRTGLTAVVVGVLFLAAMFLEPLMRLVTATPAITAPALIMVGVMMASSSLRIRWDDLTEAVPAFFIAVGIPLTFSIADGMAFGFISYAALMLLTGRGRQVHPILYLMAVLFLWQVATLSRLSA
jgi:AGZA family xanthine/uracil permease-like MFS transporter